MVNSNHFIDMSIILQNSTKIIQVNTKIHQNTHTRYRNTSKYFIALDFDLTFKN